MYLDVLWAQILKFCNRQLCAEERVTKETLIHNHADKFELDKIRSF